MTPHTHRQDFIVGERYQLVKKIASGAFGTVVSLAINIASGEKVVLKLESFQAPWKLLFESKIYEKLEGGVGIPHTQWYGFEMKYKVRVLAMDLLGPSLESLFNICSRKFSMKTVVLLAEQMIDRLEFIHSKNALHCELKPETFLIGTGQDCNKLYLIDFGSAREYQDSQTGEHNPYYVYIEKDFIGTARYASINAHNGVVQSRRDDMESMGYIIMYLMRGNLPWQGLEGAKQKLKKIREKKISTSVELLCEDYPAEFAMYLNYCRGLRFEQEPDYLYLRQLFRSLLQTLDHKDDFSFDWTVIF